MKKQRLLRLPNDITAEFRAVLQPHYGLNLEGQEMGVYRLVGIRRTAPRSFEEQRLIVTVEDIDGLPLTGVPVAFGYSTAAKWPASAEHRWQPPAVPVFETPTQPGGKAEMVLGHEGVIHPGQQGGVTVFVNDPRYASDVVTGLGMLPDHTGLALAFQLQEPGRASIREEMADLRALVEGIDLRLKAVEDGIRGFTPFDKV